jgi:ubiquinone/menaquinone biosynthesis C-methylase UbiE
MGWFLATVYERLMRASEEACLGAWRAEILAPLCGAVLEVGAGTGANLPHYPAAVTRLVMAEPDPHMHTRLKKRAAGDARVEVADASLERLPWPEATFDAVVATLVLCSVPDPVTALGEIRRVLRPGGAFVFLEHVAADDRPDRLKWQRRIEPVWRRCLGNCHLTRRTDEVIASVGFRIESLQRASIRKAAPWARPSIRGSARK